MIDFKVSGVSRGQKVTLVAYNGGSVIEAEAIASYLEVYQKFNKPLQLNDGEFYIRITNIESIENRPDIVINNLYTFQVRITGVIEAEKVSFCMRCFANSAVPLNESNFCNICGSEGTCIEMNTSDAKYLRENIVNAMKNYKEMLNK